MGGRATAMDGLLIIITNLICSGLKFMRSGLEQGYTMLVEILGVLGPVEGPVANTTCTLPFRVSSLHLGLFQHCGL